ncbi:MAG: cytochrome b/b6 domain-containing protein [Fimbriimonadales bacterium]
MHRRLPRRPIRFAVLTGVLIAGLAMMMVAVAWPQGPAQGGSYKIESHQIATCLQCHGGVGFVAMDPSGHVRSYYVDGQALTNSVHKSLTCQECHAGIDQVPHDKSKIVTPTCGMCHSDEADLYATSAHQPKNAVDLDHPSCLYCHGGNAHAVSSPKGYTAEQKLGICVRCHSNTALMEKWHVDTDAVQSYKESFHGKAVRYGSQKAATCVDCHTAHHVLPKANPASSVNPAHSMDTCSKCHTGAVAKFASSGVTHLLIKEKESPVLRGEIGLFTMLTWGVLGLLSLSIILDVRAGVKHQFRRFKENLKEDIMRGDNPEEAREEKVYLWFTPYQRVQHWLFAISFIVLALTGLPLRFYEDPHMAGLYNLLGGLQVARMIHRTAAVVMICATIMHFGYLIWSWKKINFSIRKIVMLPNKQDWRDHIETWRFYLGKRRTVPTFGRFSFRAKFGYFAVFWGLPIMVISGLCLWFPVAAAKALPPLGVSVAYLMHSDEAILAIGAIFIWHLYTTIFSPLYLPLGRKMIFGTVTQEEAEFEHGRHKLGESK